MGFDGETGELNITFKAKFHSETYIFANYMGLTTHTH